VTPTRKKLTDGLAALALLALPWLLYGAALDLWWTQDDFFQLRFAAGHEIAEYALDPGVWQRLPNQVLTPLLFASYELDLAVAGLDPAAFYAHQLLSLGLAAGALYGLLRLWLAVPWALLGGGAFLLGPPIASLAPLLMVRHYPESVLLAVLSAWLFVVGTRRAGAGAWIPAVLSGCLYFAACLAKEIAVPLPAVLALLPAGTPRLRLRRLAPHAGALALYAGYRIWMLGTPLGGYGWSVRPGEWPGLALGLPARLARELAGPGPWGWAVLAGLVGGVVFLAVRSRRSAGLLGVGILAALLPVLPVAAEVAPRYASSAWLLLATALPVSARRLAGSTGPRSGRRRAVLGLTLALLLAAALAGNRRAWSHHHGLAARMSAEYQGFLELGPGEYLRHPAASPASMGALLLFARDLLGRRPEGGWFYDDLYLCPVAGARSGPVLALWAYDPDAGRLRDVTGELPALRQSHCRSIRWDAPLEASFRRGGGVLAWELGPSRAGGYAFLLEDGRMRYEVPRRGAFRREDLDLAGLRVRYDSPEGWVTYSPPLPLEPGRSGLRWRRGVDGSPPPPAPGPRASPGG
jgi:hypothetical protein